MFWIVQVLLNDAPGDRFVGSADCDTSAAPLTRDAAGLLIVNVQSLVSEVWM